MADVIRQCRRCVMDDGVPGVRVFDDGTCSYCREYLRWLEIMTRTNVARREQLDAIIARIKRGGQRKEYDALIGLSGGLDSSYAAWVARQKGLRLLGVHVDTGWDTPTARANITALTEKLDIELVYETPSWEHFRDLQLAFLRASVRNAEIPTDHVIAATLYRVAQRRRLRWIITGGNFITEGVALPEAYGHYNRDLRFIRAVHRQFGTLPLRVLPTMGIPQTLYYRYVLKIRVLRILDYIDYRRAEAEETLRREIGWESYGAKHHESVYTRFFQSYILPKKFGLDKRKFHLSALVCSGQMTRDEALQILSSPPYPDPTLLQSDMAVVLEKLRLSPEEFDRIMRTPPRPDSAFPSNRWLFEIARWLAKRGIRLGE